MNNIENLRILYKNAIAGSIVNSDLMIRAIESDLDSLIEILSKSRTSIGLRASDREIALYLEDRADLVASQIRSVKEDSLNVSSIVSDYIASDDDSDLERLVREIDRLKTRLAETDEMVGTLTEDISESSSSVKSQRYAVSLSESMENLIRLSNHVGHLFMLILTTEGSVNQCRINS